LHAKLLGERRILLPVEGDDRVREQHTVAGDGVEQWLRADSHSAGSVCKKRDYFFSFYAIIILILFFLIS
jgi:hypothetical protein